MMMRTMYVVTVVVVLAGAAMAQPGVGSGMPQTPPGGVGTAGSGAPSVASLQPAPPPVAPVATDQKTTCNAAIAADEAWARELVTTEQMVGIVRNIHGQQLLEVSRRAHIADADAIAKNKRHVIMAYAAMWFLSVGFLIFLWRRQQGLRGQIDQLKRDLETALKDGK